MRPPRWLHRGAGAGHPPAWCAWSSCCRRFGRWNSTPRPDRAVTLEGYGVIRTRGDRRDARQAADRHGRQARRRRPIADLPGAVVAPRPDRAVGLQGVCIGGARGDRCHPGNRNRQRRRATDLCAVSELAAAVGAPGPDHAGVRQGHDVTRTRCNGRTCERRRCQREDPHGSEPRTGDHLLGRHHRIYSWDTGVTQPSQLRTD